MVRPDPVSLVTPEIQAISNLRTQALVEALATVEREHFLQCGLWLVRAEGDIGGPPRYTPDADAKHLYHNLAVAIDSTRQLFSGGPGVVSMQIDGLALQKGQTVLHIVDLRAKWKPVIEADRAGPLNVESLSHQEQTMWQKG